MAGKGKGEKAITKDFILKQLDEDELDLSMCNLSEVPVRELVRWPRRPSSVYGTRSGLPQISS